MSNHKSVGVIMKKNRDKFLSRFCVRDEDTILELIFLSLNNPTKLNLA